MNFSAILAWASAFLVAAALFYAPLAYGCTRPEMLPTLYGLLLGAIVLGLLSFVLGREWPALPAYATVILGLLLAQGWWTTWDPPLPSMVIENGGTVDIAPADLFRLSFDSMLMTTVLGVTFYVVCGLFADVFIRRFLLMSAAGSGVLVCALGVFLKTAGSSFLPYLWSKADNDWNDFALYRYHGNAGSFLILVWPLILTFARRAWTPNGGLVKKALWTLAALACAAGFFLNSSKAALVIGLLMLPWPFLSQLLRMRRESQAVLAGCVIVLGTVAMLESSEFNKEAAFERLTDSQEVSGAVHGRLDSYEDDLSAVPDAGVVGFGPGTFQVIFPYQQSTMRNVGAAVRAYAHEDYLQTVLEWGWLGTAGWAVLVFGGLWRGFHVYRQRSYFTSKTERHLVLASVLALCGVLAQATVDFPLQIASLRLFFLLHLALCWAAPKLVSMPPRGPRQRFRLPVPAEYASK